MSAINSALFSGLVGLTSAVATYFILTAVSKWWQARNVRLGNDRDLGGADMEEPDGFDITAVPDGNGTVPDRAALVADWRSAAELGDVDAMCKLGIACSEGCGTKRDAVEAVKWFRAAAELGSAEAMDRLGDALISGAGIGRNEDEAFSWWRKAADAGNARGMISVGWCYVQGKPVAQDYAEALKWFGMAAEHSDTLAMTWLASLHSNGWGVEKDEAAAATWYLKAADIWYRKAVEHRDTEAIRSLAYAYHNGQGVKQDDAVAVRWLHKAAELGDTQGMLILGEVYSDGIGVKKDAAEAVRWYRKAAELGNGDGTIRLGYALHTGAGVKKNHVEAVAWWRKAAEIGEPIGMHNLFIAYYNGYGVKKDRKEALNWRKRAAEHGHVDSVRMLGMAYFTEDEVEKDDAEAVKWFRMGAHAGDTLCMSMLGMAYEKGDAVPLDYAEALKWQRKAADLGEAEAMRNLSHMYTYGHGVEKDEVEAKKWWQKAMDKDNEDVQQGKRNPTKPVSKIYSGARLVLVVMSVLVAANCAGMLTMLAICHNAVGWMGIHVDRVALAMGLSNLVNHPVWWVILRVMLLCLPCLLVYMGTAWLTRKQRAEEGMAIRVYLVALYAIGYALLFVELPGSGIQKAARIVAGYLGGYTVFGIVALVRYTYVGRPWFSLQSLIAVAAVSGVYLWSASSSDRLTVVPVCIYIAGILLLVAIGVLIAQVCSRCGWDKKLYGRLGFMAVVIASMVYLGIDRSVPPETHAVAYGGVSTGSIEESRELQRRFLTDKGDESISLPKEMMDNAFAKWQPNRVLSLSNTMEKAWAEHKHIREAIGKLSALDIVASVRTNLGMKGLSWDRLDKVSHLYCNYARLKVLQGKSEEGLVPLAQWYSIMRKAMPQDTVIYDRGSWECMAEWTLENLCSIVRDAGTQQMLLVEMKKLFSPLRPEEVSLSNMVLNEAMMFYTASRLGWSHYHAQQASLIPFVEMSFVFRAKRNETMREYQQRMPRLLAAMSASPMKSFWEQGLCVSNLVAPINMNIVGTHMLNSYLCALNSWQRESVTLKVKSDLLTVRLSRLLGEQCEIRDYFSGEPYMIDVKNEVPYSAGPDKKAGTDDDVRLE